MKSNIEEIKPNLYVKKSRGGWRIVYPLRNTDGSINWRNVFFGDMNLFVIAIIIVVVIVILGSAYRHDVNALQACWEDPCRYCMNVTTRTLSSLKLP